LTGAPTPPLLCEIAIEPKSRADQQRLADALHHIVANDRNLRSDLDAKSGQFRLLASGYDELEAAIATLRGTYKVDASAGAPQVA